MGSSPLSRGILHVRTSRRRRLGIIPALAGNTLGAESPTRCSTDHPRSRGEYTWQRVTRLETQGSSPLSRGIHEHRHRCVDRVRIIPALAGNTRCVMLLRDGAEDHPRSRGEYTCLFPNGRKVVGSSPLSRGIPPAPPPSGKYSRIIPALAGNTASKTSSPTAARDHPRSRGEYPCRPDESFRASGSSPLSRGIPPQQSRRQHEPGIIPALAGNTSGV